jgi:hypothetical protein
MDLRHDAFVQAVLEISQKPDRFDSQKGSWVDFLAGAARRILGKMFQSSKARGDRETQYGKNRVADRESATRDIADDVADAELVRKITAEVAQTDEERIYVAHLGEAFQEIAQALNLSHMTEIEQQQRVKVIRDRVSQRLKRWKGK